MALGDEQIKGLMDARKAAIQSTKGGTAKRISSTGQAPMLNKTQQKAAKVNPKRFAAK
jgi:hypothetical protein